MTLASDFQIRLARACREREGHPDAFSLSAVQCRDGLTRLWWRDARTGEGRRLGQPLSPAEVDGVLPALFTQLRAWRYAAEEGTTERAMAAGGQR